MKRYDTYKDSGIEWIGEIPGHWQVIPMRFLLREKITDGPHETPKFISEGVPFLSVDGIQGGELVFDDCRKITYEDHEKYKQKCIVEKSDILMGKAASVGKVAQVKVDFEFSIWSPLALLKPNHNKIISTYFEYFLKSTYAKDNVNILSTFNTQQNISMTDIPKIYFVIPKSIQEQTAIAHYLDRKTAEIDELIADKKRLLELYEEEKTAIINQAVTKGVNNNAKMKDSGIEWLGEIPEHWEVKRLKYISLIVLGKMLTPIDKGGYFLKSYLRAANLTWLEVDVNDVKEMWFSESELNRYRLKYHDLLISEGGEVGRTCIWRNELTECYIQNSVHKVTMNENCNPNYFLNLFYLYGQLGAFDFMVNRISIAHLTGEKLKEIEFVVPPIEEQQTIVHYIETETARIGAKIAKTEKLIELYTEYRNSLISEVVTGEIKVVD